MRLFVLCLAGLLLLIQYPLWLGKGGWLRVWEMEQQVAVAQKRIDALKARNAKLGSEVQDLKDGTGAVEERARYELGMIRQDEIFVRVLPPAEATSRSPAAPTPPSSDASGTPASARQP